MARWVVDSSVLIDASRDDPRALGVLAWRRSEGHQIWSVTPVRTELWAGQRPGDGPIIHDLFASMLWRNVDEYVADLAGRMASRFVRTHPGIETVDFLVAAAARTLGADLLTLNVKDFPMFPDLEPAYT